MSARTTKLLNQFRRPTGWIGRVNASDMNRRHSKLTDWGLAKVSIERRWTILDVGCGGGRTVQKFAAMAPEGRVYGVDYSEASVAAARRTNRRGIEASRIDVRLASVSHLPFSESMFDLVTAVETHYYWPNLPADMREVLRVVKPGGTFLLVAEAYKGGKYDRRNQLFADAMTATGSFSHLSVDEHRDLFTGAGFVDVQVFEDYEKGWVCAMGKKAS
jgi:SAM-dependent methyltransferase